MRLLLHAYGRFDRRLLIGPVSWPFHDLLWIHQGAAQLSFADGGSLTLRAPDGVLIRPNTPFSGHAIGAAATASVCHFETDASYDPGYLSAAASEKLDLSALVRMALRLATEVPDASARRTRLLQTILDGFTSAEKTTPIDRDELRVDRAWTLAAQNLHLIRGLVDVAALIDLRESAFRTLHRRVHGTPAGAHLRGLRLAQTQTLLATTGLTLDEIAKRVGYGHAETLNAAFRRARGITPGAFRRHAKPFA